MYIVDFCPECRAPVSDASAACAMCGHELTAPKQAHSASKVEPQTAHGSRHLVYFWIVSLLFLAAVVAGFYLLIPAIL